MGIEQTGMRIIQEGANVVKKEVKASAEKLAEGFVREATTEAERKTGSEVITNIQKALIKGEAVANANKELAKGRDCKALVRVEHPGAQPYDGVSARRQFEDEIAAEIESEAVRPEPATKMKKKVESSLAEGGLNTLINRDIIPLHDLLSNVKYGEYIYKYVDKESGETVRLVSRYGLSPRSVPCVESTLQMETTWPTFIEKLEVSGVIEKIRTCLDMIAAGEKCGYGNRLKSFGNQALEGVDRESFYQLESVYNKYKDLKSQVGLLKSAGKKQEAKKLSKEAAELKHYINSEMKCPW